MFHPGVRPFCLSVNNFMNIFTEDVSVDMAELIRLWKSSSLDRHVWIFEGFFTIARQDSFP